MVRSYNHVADLLNSEHRGLLQQRISKSTVKKTLSRFEQTSSIKDHSKTGRRKTVTNDETS